MNNLSRALEITYTSEIKPYFGHRYEHFSEEELTWIFNRNGAAVKSRFKAFRRFIKHHSDLEVLESELINGKVLEEKLKNSFLDWYVTYLIAFKRINVPVDICFKINLLEKELSFKESPICNPSFIENFIQNAKEMGYKDSTIKSIRVDLVWIFVYFEGSEEFPANKIDEYEEILKEIGHGKKEHIRLIKNVLHNMGYTKINNNVRSVYKTNPDDYNFHLPEIGKAFSEYCAFLNEKKAHKTAKTIISHVRSFLNYLCENCHEIKSFREINNSTIVGFREFEINETNMFGNKNSNATINHRLQAINNFWSYLINEKRLNLSKEIITEFDFLKEPKIFPIKVDKDEIIRLVSAIRNDENDEYMQQKLILIILILTGRRIHEVLTLELNCIKSSLGKTKLFLHKTKKNKPTFEFINNECTAAVLKAREYAKNIKQPIYSKLDNRNCRRLFPSSHYKGRSLVCYNSVELYFKRIQIDNGITDECGKAKYTLHDNKRNSVSNMLSAGITPQEISCFLDQEVRSLPHYESYNEYAIDTLRIVEKKGLLLGGSFVSDFMAKDENEDIKIVLDILNNIDVINRNKENLIYKIRNPEMTMPLTFAICADNNMVGLCGEILCATCDEILPIDFQCVDNFALKMFRHIYKYKPKLDFKRLEHEIINVIIIGYKKLGVYDEISIDAKIKNLKKIARNEVKK